MRADLHVHTLLAPNETTTGTPPSVRGMVGAAQASGVRILAITDHNTIENVDEALSLASADLFILPGIEISAAEGHLLALFAPSATPNLVDLARPAVLALRTLRDGSLRSTRSMADLIDEVHVRGGLAIAAHVDTADGLIASANPATLSNILTQPGLAAIEITRLESVALFSDDDTDSVRREAWRERVTHLGDEGSLARIMSSDAHSLEQVGSDDRQRVLTRLRIDELNFLGVRAAIRLQPDARCRLESTLEANYPHLLRATFNGGFLDGVTMEFSENLTCLIGSRGTGKSTALRAIQAALGAPIGEDEDAHPNMPDRTDVDFVDALGTIRRAARDRHGLPYDAAEPNAAISLPTIDLEQNVGMAFLVEPPDSQPATTEFLSRFINTTRIDADEVALLSDLDENAALIRSTAAATSQLKKLRDEQASLRRNLRTAADAKLTEVAAYARILAAEEPFLRDLGEALASIPQARLPEVPDLEALADEHDVDLAERPAADFVDELRVQLASVGTMLANTEKTTQDSLKRELEPAAAILDRWKKRHEAWGREIENRRAQLKEAGLTLQVEQLDVMRRRLLELERDIRRFEGLRRDHLRARAERKSKLADLRTLRERRLELRVAISDRLASELNERSSAKVSVSWKGGAVLEPYGARLGQLFNLRSPRSERLAAVIKPSELAEIGWNGDGAALGALKSGSDAFLADADAALDVIRKYDVLFELETMRVEDRPEIRVRYEGDAPGPGRPLRELSLGQVRSILLGFLLSSQVSAPLILDQPEDQLDGPFLAEVVVGYILSAKERRQLILATHNPNLVVLGDAELVLPLHAAKGRGEVVDAGSIDSASTKAQVVRILEGGLRAFTRRASRYGFRLQTIAD